MNAPAALAFDEVSHTYRHAGRLVPGVTSILRPLSSFDGIPTSVLAAKADLGRRVHLACELDDQDDLDEGSVEGDVEPYLAAWRKFRRETGCMVLLVEQRVFHAGWSYAGTLDRVLLLNRANWLVDLKTCFTTPRTAGPQTAAYKAALGRDDVQHRAALRLLPDGTYRFEPLTDPDDWSAFVAALTLLRYKEKHP